MTSLVQVCYHQNDLFWAPFGSIGISKGIGFEDFGLFKMLPENVRSFKRAFLRRDIFKLLSLEIVSKPTQIKSIIPFSSSQRRYKIIFVKLGPS